MFRRRDTSSRIIATALNWTSSGTSIRYLLDISSRECGSRIFDASRRDRGVSVLVDGAIPAATGAASDVRSGERENCSARAVVSLDTGLVGTTGPVAARDCAARELPASTVARCARNASIRRSFTRVDAFRIGRPRSCARVRRRIPISRQAV